MNCAFPTAFGECRILGRALQGIYQAAHRHELLAVWREEFVAEGAHVEIVFEKADLDGQPE